MLTLIERAARIVAEGTAVDVLAHDEELTSREAAVLLGVSRQYLVRLLDRGEIPFTRTGSHRRIRGTDLLAFRERRDASRREGLAKLAETAPQAGGYAEPTRLGPGRPRQGEAGVRGRSIRRRPLQSGRESCRERGCRYV